MRPSDSREKDFTVLIGDDLPEGIDKNDPIFRQAYAEIFKERIHRFREIAAQKPKWTSRQSIPYRPGIAQMRRIFSRLGFPLVVVSAFSYWRSCFLIAAGVGALAVVTSVGLATSLLGEVLYGSGTDNQIEYIGTDGPFREYSFRPFIRNPVFLFALIGNAITCLVFGYAELHVALAALRWITFSKVLDAVSSAYFSLVTFATVGYGDFYPDSPLAKVLVSSEIAVALFILAIVLATSTSWVLSRREELAAERSAAKAIHMQSVETAMKNVGLGLYEDKAQILKEVQSRVKELKRT